MEHSRHSLPRKSPALAPIPGRGRFFGIHAEAALQTLPKGHFACLARLDTGMYPYPAVMDDKCGVDVAIPLRFAASEVLEKETSPGSRGLGTGRTRPGTPRMGIVPGLRQNSYDFMHNNLPLIHLRRKK